MARIFTSLNDPDLVELIHEGAIGILPTDTVYGIVAKFADEQAVQRLYEAKQRERKPGTTIAASVDDLVGVGFPSEQLRPVAALWPAPLSVVIDATNISASTSGGMDSLPVRIPDVKELNHLLRATGPLLTSSANMPGEPIATTITEAMAYFGDTVDYYVDLGDLGHRPPSTIIGFDATGDVIIHRQGAADVSSLLEK